MTPYVQLRPAVMLKERQDSLTPKGDGNAPG